MELTKKSQEFLEDLRLYLFSSGKKEAEINEVIEELTDHLIEAEKEGKSVDHITGLSPKAYMESIAEEMPFDVKGMLVVIPAILFGVFAYIMLGDAIRGTMSYTTYHVIGFPVVILIGLGSVVFLFKIIAKNRLKLTWQWILLGGSNLFVIGLFVAVYILSNNYGTPFIEFGFTGRIVATILSIAIFIAIAVWAKIWSPIIIPALLFIPEVIAESFIVNEDVKALVITSGFVLIAIYMIFLLRKDSSSKGLPRKTKN
ncbi:HAAS domain-containing protein [Bacillus alkalicellulosilyticus]|uniref:HAAS domain-containing protein n=1 Tax=Alkalihalobacterium alkalicellulosilyticum TaxID=1912214 RepID=UPI000995E321|nr:hypothetical protein [Bacillus alkalicellulosilyticus]